MSTLIQESQQQSDISTMTEILINTNTAMINVVWEGFNSNTRIALMYIDSFSNRQLLLKTSSACRPPCLQKPNQVFDIPITMSTIYNRGRHYEVVKERCVRTLRRLLLDLLYHSPTQWSPLTSGIDVQGSTTMYRRLLQYVLLQTLWRQSQLLNCVSIFFFFR